MVGTRKKFRAFEARNFHIDFNIVVANDATFLRKACGGIAQLHATSTGTGSKREAGDTGKFYCVIAWFFSNFQETQLRFFLRLAAPM